MDEKRRERIAKLEADIESAESVLSDVLEFLSDDLHLTDKGKALRADLWREIAKSARDVEAIRQEHMPS
jgi:hypothetical protein